MAVAKNIDAASKGEVARYLETLQVIGQVKKCVHLRLDRTSEYYYPRCEEDYASMHRATNVPRPTYFKWPKCPDPCPYYVESLNFSRTVSRDQHGAIQRGDIRGPDPSSSSGVVIAYGTPSPPASRKPLPVPADPPPKPLAVPEKVTLAWMFHNVHWRVWATIGLLLVASFFAGTEVGPIAWLETLLKRIGAFH